MYKTIAAALANTDVEAGVKRMLADCVRPCLSVYEADRHAFQTAVVGMIAETLDASEKTLQSKLADAQKTLAGSEAEKATRQERLKEAEAAVADKQNVLTAAEEAARAGATALAEAAAALKDALATQKSSDSELQQSVSRRELLDKSKRELFVPLKDTAGNSGDAKKLCAVAKQFACDGALIDSLPLALSKDPAARGSFDGLAIGQFEEWMEKVLGDLTTTISNGGEATADLAAKVETATATKQVAESNKATTATASSEAKGALKEAAAAAKTAKAAVDGFEVDRKRFSDAVEDAQTELLAFEQGARAAFEQLRHSEAPVTEKAVVTEEVPVTEAAPADVGAEDAQTTFAAEVEGH